MDSLVVFSPAKINLMLAVTGRRPDGFHDLVSVVAPLTFGDSVRLQRLADAAEIRLTCDDPTVPLGRENLAVRAAEAFRTATGIREGVAIELTKRIPLGAGLGGGSSNAVAVLRGLNVLHGTPLTDEQLSGLAATLASDGPLFLAGGVCIMRGRGEQITRLTPMAQQRLSAARFLVFKPHFGVATPWAYAQLAADRGAYLDPADAEARVTGWLSGTEGLPALLFNNFEPLVFRKYLALPVMKARLQGQRGIDGVLMSGSGSACFAVLNASADVPELAAKIREALGGWAFVQEARVG